MRDTRSNPYTQDGGLTPDEWAAGSFVNFYDHDVSGRMTQDDRSLFIQAELDKTSLPPQSIQIPTRHRSSPAGPTSAWGGRSYRPRS